LRILWEQIRVLEGQTLPTVSGRTEFDITAVDDGFIRVVPQSSGKSRIIQREEFERAEAIRLATANVTPIQLRRAGISEFNPVYVAAIIRAAVGQLTPG
jgi:hypothetical protein